MLVLRYWLNPFTKVRKVPEYIKRCYVSISNLAFAMAEACKLNNVMYCTMQRIPVCVLLWYRYSSISASPLYIPVHRLTYTPNLCVCIYVYIKNYTSAHSLTPVCWISYLSQTLSFILNINVQRAAEQVELLSASQCSLVSECMLHRGKKIVFYCNFLPSAPTTHLGHVYWSTRSGTLKYFKLFFRKTK